MKQNSRRRQSAIIIIVFHPIFLFISWCVLPLHVPLTCVSSFQMNLSLPVRCQRQRQNDHGISDDILSLYTNNKRMSRNSRSGHGHSHVSRITLQSVS